MTDSIQRRRAPPPEPSHFATVSQVLDLVRGSDRGVAASTPSGAIAAHSIPRRLPHTQTFMAWAVYYQYPEARRMTLEALDRK